MAHHREANDWIINLERNVRQLRVSVKVSTIEKNQSYWMMRQDDLSNQSKFIIHLWRGQQETNKELNAETLKTWRHLDSCTSASLREHTVGIKHTHSEELEAIICTATTIMTKKEVCRVKKKRFNNRLSKNLELTCHDLGIWLIRIWNNGSKTELW